MSAPVPFAKRLVTAAVDPGIPLVRNDVLRPDTGGVLRQTVGSCNTHS